MRVDSSGVGSCGLVMSLGGFGMCLDGSGKGPGISPGGFVISFGASACASTSFA